MKTYRYLTIALALLLFLDTATVIGSVMRGDINDDGQLNSADTIFALQVASGKNPALTIDDMSFADINGNNRLDLGEAVYSLKAQTYAWTAEYFDNIDLTGLVIKQKEMVINGQWGSDAPFAGMEADTFSVRWSGDFNFNGTYKFTATSDDGIRVWVGSERIMDHWVNQSPTTNTVTKYLSGAQHVLVEYFENGGGAVAEFSWEEIVPTCNDGIQNQDETAIDCGGVCQACPVDEDGDGIYNNIDCDDNDNTVWQSVELYQDTDGDTYGTGAATIACIGESLPPDSALNNDDCNDNVPAINPGAPDLCGNGIDEDCNGIDASCTDTCLNGQLDFGEYWTDCGGICGTCPTCVDGIQNGDEEGVDCGGTCLDCDATGTGTFTDITNNPDYPYNFRIYLPPGYSEFKSYPLIIFLHGAGERGNDLNKVDNNGPLKHVNASWWNYDFIIIAPQVPTDGWWNSSLVKQLYEHAITEFRIDQHRVYITGLSMGGFGVNAIMKSTSTNEWVTSDAEICGQVETGSLACNYKETPSWGFACDHDPTVGNAWSISPWAKILHGADDTYSCGNTAPNPNIKISLFDCNSHDSWSRVYDPFKSESNYTLSTDREVNSDHQFPYGDINGAPPIYDWFLHFRK